MNKLLWAGFELLPLANLLLVARQAICVSGGYFYAVNVKCFAIFGAILALTIKAALLLIAIGCAVKILRRAET